MCKQIFIFFHLLTCDCNTESVKEEPHTAQTFPEMNSTHFKNGFFIYVNS